MSNHYHVVLHVRQDLAQNWSDHEVITRWHCLFNGNLFSQPYLAGDTLLDAEKEKLNDEIEKWRERLTDISGFMRIVNEFIARKANAEDQCSDSFWESRFKSQALLDERALLSCMAYVDLFKSIRLFVLVPERVVMLDVGYHFFIHTIKVIHV
jgi:hypothetical protein